MLRPPAAPTAAFPEAIPSQPSQQLQPLQPLHPLYTLHPQERSQPGSEKSLMSAAVSCRDSRFTTFSRDARSISMRSFWDGDGEEEEDSDVLEVRAKA